MNSLPTRRAHEYALLLPSLTEDEFAALTESIKEYGVINPITLDDAGLILDGVHRDRVCATLGIDCPVNQVGPMPDEKKLRLAFGLNFRQRTLDPERRRELVARLSTEKGLSIRQISRATGWSKSQVQRDLKPLPDPVKTSGGVVTPSGFVNTAMSLLG
jgi:ParB-like chromosome segregation protein Spo0J